MAAAVPVQATLWTGVERTAPRVVVRPGTPEIFFAKSIDNSRLVKVADPRRRREMAMFGAALAMVFVLVMIYGWQHISSIEYGYKIEQLQATHDQLVEVNRTLVLEQASLRDAERIDVLARRMGMQSPDPGQVQRLEPSDRELSGNGEVMARAGTLSVVSLVQ